MNHCLRLIGFAAVILAASTVAAEESAESWMKYMVGTWQWKTPDGDDGELIFKKDKSAPVLIGRGQAGGETWIIIWGYRKDTGEIMEHGYNANGGYGTTAWKLDKNGDLVGRHNGWTPDGKAQSKKRIAKAEGGHFKFYRSEHVQGGKEQDDVELTAKRKKKED